MEKPNTNNREITSYAKIVKQAIKGTGNYIKTDSNEEFVKINNLWFKMVED